MKTFKKDHLPESITYNGKIFKYNAHVSGAMNANGTMPNSIERELKKQERSSVLVLVLSKNLKGRTDLHGNPYQPSKHIFTT